MASILERARAIPLFVRDVIAIQYNVVHIKHSQIFVKDSKTRFLDYKKNLRMLKHPSSNHMISRYSLYYHQNSKYHFNDVGEQSLNFCAIESSTEAEESGHEVYMWPDNIKISNLTTEDVALLSDRFLDYNKLIFASELPPHWKCGPIPPTIVIPCTHNLGSKDVLEEWVRHDVKKLNLEYDVVYSTPMIGHRMNCQMLLLPEGRSYGNVESKDKLAKILMGLI